MQWARNAVDDLHVSGPAVILSLLAIPFLLSKGLVASMGDVLIMLAAPFYLLWVRRLVLRWFRSRSKPDLCSKCGYDLRATPARCPECGTAAAALPDPPV